MTLAALCSAEAKDKVLASFFRDSTSIGVRVTAVERHALKREVGSYLAVLPSERACVVRP